MIKFALEEEIIELTEQERQSAIWLRIEQYIEHRIGRLRKLNDAHQPEWDTAMIRGGIAELKSLMKAVDKKPPQFDTKRVHYE